MMVLKLNDKMTQRLGEKVGEQVNDFFKRCGEDGEFMEKVTGFLVVYSPMCCVLIETEDQEFFEHVMESLYKIVLQHTSTKEGTLIENVWISFQTEEVPIRAFNQWYLRSF